MKLDPNDALNQAFKLEAARGSKASCKTAGFDQGAC
jgi:hypothetical protein